MKNNLKRLSSLRHSKRLADVVTIPKATYSINRGILEEILEPRTDVHTERYSNTEGKKKT